MGVACSLEEDFPPQRASRGQGIFPTREGGMLKGDLHKPVRTQQSLEREMIRCDPRRRSRPVLCVGDELLHLHSTRYLRSLRRFACCHFLLLLFRHRTAYRECEVDADLCMTCPGCLLLDLLPREHFAIHQGSATSSASAHHTVRSTR